jgi:hypothetical protein
MRKRLMLLAVLGVFALMFAYPAGVPAASPESHPEIHNAIDSLRHAKEHLEHAAHDYGGHRLEAIASIDHALEQLNICLKYDK